MNSSRPHAMIAKLLVFALATGFSVNAIANKTDIETGIVVNAKTYDERAIQQLIAQIDARLGQLQFIQQETLQNATGSLAGGTRRSSSTSFSVSMVPTPGITTVTGPPEAGGDPVTTTTTTESSVTPTIPEPVAEALTYTAPTAYGLSARDLLSEQLELSYRVAGLRLGLERSIEDHFDTSSKTLRRLALIGVDVSIDEARIRKGAVAEVQLEVRPTVKIASKEVTDKSGEVKFECGIVQPTLIQMLPQSESYNRVSITDKKSQIGFGVLAGVISLGIGNRKNTENLYVIQELDTISYRLTPTDRDNLRVGWRFRPALGQKKLVPGLRKVFLLVSLPQETTEYELKCGGVQKYEVYAKTSWRAWDDKKRASGSIVKERRSELSSGWDPVRKLRYKREEFRDAFFPYVSGIDWHELDNERISAVVTGTSFFGDIEVVSGGKRLRVGNGIQIDNVERFNVELPLTALFETPPGLVVGRYTSNRSNALELRLGLHEVYPPSAKAQVRAYDTKHAELLLTLRNYPNEFLRNYEAPNRVLVRVGNKVYGGQRRPAIERSTAVLSWCEDRTTDGCGDLIKNETGEKTAKETKTTARFRVPIAELLATGGIVVVEPFFPHQHYRRFLPLSEISGLFRAELAGKSPIAGNSSCERVENGKAVSICTAYAIIGPDESTDYEARIGSTQLQTLASYPNTTGRRYVQVPNALIGKSTPITIIHNDHQWFIPLSKVSPSSNVVVVAVEEITQHDARWVVVTGSGLGAVTAVYMGNRELPFGVEGDKKSLRVYFDSSITKNPGIREIMIESAGGKRTFAQVKVTKGP